MFCKKCGKQLSDGAKFCPACGTQQAQHQPQTNYGAPPQASQPQTNYGAPPPPQPNYGAPQGYPQPQANYAPPQDYGPPNSYSGGYAARPSSNGKNLLLLTVILVTIGLLIAGIFKGTMFNLEHRVYKEGSRGRYTDDYSKVYIPYTMDSWYFAIIKNDGFSDFSDHLDGDTKGMQVATAYTALSIGVIMAVLLIISAIIGLAGNCRTAGMLAAVSAFISALPHIMYMILTFYFKSKDYEEVSLSFVPMGMIAAAVIIGSFCTVAAKSMKQTSASPAGNWR